MDDSGDYEAFGLNRGTLPKANRLDAISYGLGSLVEGRGILLLIGFG